MVNVGKYTSPMDPMRMAGDCKGFPPSGEELAEFFVKSAVGVI